MEFFKIIIIISIVALRTQSFKIMEKNQIGKLEWG
jgi:hypothetical protein